MSKITLGIAQDRLKEKNIPVIINKWGGSTNAKSEFIDKEHGIFEAKYSHVISGHTRHPKRKRSTALSVEEVQKRLLTTPNGISLVNWCGSANRESVFLDPAFGEFRGTFQAVISGKKLHPERRARNYTNRGKERRLSEASATKKLAQKQPNITIVTWGGKSTAVSCFLDKQFGEFEATFNQVISGVKSHPARMECNRKSRQRGLSVTEVEARLLSLPVKVQLIKWSGSVTEKSLFSIEGREVIISLQSLLRKKHFTPFNRQKLSKALWQDRHYIEKVKNGSSKVDTPALTKQRRATMQARYQVDHPLQCSAFREKAQQTSKERYRVPHYMQSIEGRERLKNLALDKGITKVFEGKTMQEIASAYGRAYTTIQAQIKRYGYSALEKVKRVGSLNLLESKVLRLLEEAKLPVKTQQRVGPYRPDFIIDDRIIVEIDGLFWHSDYVLKDNKYITHRKKVLEEKGYKVLIFREDEIIAQFSIVLSIIRHSLNVSLEKIFARKCQIVDVKKPIARELLNAWHLMGAGAGKSIGLEHKGQIVALIQIKRKGSGLEVSRFVCKPNTAVVGGFSRLIKAVQANQPNKDIVTFIDRRYGSGSYLKHLGFEESPTYQSFKWTNGKVCYHRLKYRGNTGYTHGFFKIWDCGQTPWVLPST